MPEVEVDVVMPEQLETSRTTSTSADLMAISSRYSSDPSPARPRNLEIAAPSHDADSQSRPGSPGQGQVLEAMAPDGPFPVARQHEARAHHRARRIEGW